jgi:hypothetical protein
MPDVDEARLREAKLLQAQLMQQQLQQTRGMGDISSQALGTIGSGLVRGAGGLASFPAQIGEAGVGYLASKPVVPLGMGGGPVRNPLYGARTEPMLSSAIQDATLGLSQWIEQESGFDEQSLLQRGGREIVSLVGPGAMLTQSLIGYGRRIIANPAAKQGFFNDVLRLAAENPGKVQTMEGIINAWAGTVGTLTEEQMLQDGFSPQDAQDAKAIAELIAGIGTPTVQVAGARGIESMQRKFGPRTTAELSLGPAASRLEEPQTLQNMAKAREINELAKERTGRAFEFTTSQKSRDPGLRQAELALWETGDRRTLLERGRMPPDELENMQRRLANELEQGLAPQGLSPALAQEKAANTINIEVAKATDKINDAVVRAIDEYDTVLPGVDMSMVGAAAQQRLDRVMKVVDWKTQRLYAPIANVSLPSNHIQSAAKAARFSHLEGVDGLPEDIQRIFNNNFAKGHKTTIGKVREFNSLLHETWRRASKDGYDDLSRRLGIMMEGVQKQLRAAERMGGFSGQQATRLRTANRYVRETSAIYKVGATRLASAKNIQGLESVGPEDITRLYIRPNSGKEAFTAAKQFKAALGESEKARNLIRQTYYLMLKDVARDKSGAFNYTKVENFVNRYSNNLKEFGLLDEFRDTATLASRAQNTTITQSAKIKDIQKSAYAKFAEADDPVRHVANALSSGRIARLTREVQLKGSQAVQQGYRRSIWDAVVGRARPGATDPMGNMLLNPGRLTRQLKDNKDELRKALGKEHYANLETLSDIWRFSSPAGGQGANAFRIAAAASEAPVIFNRMIFTVRRMLQGFVSRQFTAAELARFGVQDLGNKQARKIIEQVLYDPQYARELAQVSRTKQGKRLVRSLYSSAITSGTDREGAIAP